MTETGTAPRGSSTGRVLRRTVLGAALMVLLLLGGTGFRVWQVARSDDRRPVDMIVVLGAAQYHGKPTPVLRARLEQALELYEQGLTEHVVTVGGSQVGDEYTEAETGRLWLAEQGVPENKITDVETGADTLGSMKAVATLARERGWSSALIVSDPWHSLRARTMAGDFGLDAWASPTRSGPMVQTRATQFHYIFRETGGLLYYRLTHAPAEVLSGRLS
ncbi:YdcF family protein [Saccharopolyspora gregorii]|uniref:YdcF family protein n=1 Tax=Saccharopolyspora gregorii TaxID=33914 RepID=A0ABP6RWJ9_9PSEU|nr:YdcF family protein [Saccharopolyspora gregorii]